VGTEAILKEPTQAEAVSADRRSLRSRRMMREAMATLIAERGLGNFTVGDLMDRADLNRSTFYGHYSDLDCLLLQLKQEVICDIEAIKPEILAISLVEMLAFEHSGRPPAVTIRLFDVLREHGNLLRVLLSPQGDAGFQAQLRDEVCADLIRSVLHAKYTERPSRLVEYYISYYASALLGLMQRWLTDGMAEASLSMGRIMLSIMFLKPGYTIKLKGGR
jgi:AcrR family transcriptional regulator